MGAGAVAEIISLGWQWRADQGCGKLAVAVVQRIQRYLEGK